MLPYQPLNLRHFHPHPFRHRPTPPRAKMRRERVPPPNGAPPTSALNAGSRPTCRAEKALPSSGAPPKPVVPSPGNHPIRMMEVLQESGGALSALDNVPAIQDHLGPAAMAENADVRLPEPSSVDTHEREGALPALAKDTAGVGPAGKAENRRRQARGVGTPGARRGQARYRNVVGRRGPT